MENTFLYRYYIGANNATGICEVDKIAEALHNDGIEGFTILESRGAWKGKQEDSVIVEMVGDNTFSEKLQVLKKVLCNTLKQESILLTSLPIMAQF